MTGVLICLGVTAPFVAAYFMLACSAYKHENRQLRSQLKAVSDLYGRTAARVPGEPLI